MVDFLDIILKLIAAIAALIGGLWALTKYVIERGLVPAAELDLECDIVGEKDELKIIEITVHIFNKASSVLVAEEIRLILKCICKEDTTHIYDDERKFGRLQFPHSLSRDLTENRENTEIETLKLVPHDTFVQPNVDQKYSFVTAISNDVEFIHVHAEFQYAQKPKAVQDVVLRISRKIGLIQYSLQHIYKPHTIQKAFSVMSSDTLPNE